MFKNFIIIVMTIIMVFFNDKLYANDEKVLTFSNIEKIPHQIISEKILKDIYLHAHR